MSDTDTDPNTDTDAVAYEQFDQSDEPGAAARALDGMDQDLRRLGEVPLEMSVEIGRTQMTVGETLDLRAGSIVTLDRLAGEPVDLLVNGTPIARGEVVVVDEQFGLRVTEILEGDGSPPSENEEELPRGLPGEGDEDGQA
jgi:flagellar motor switch protein FliN/FliY